MISIPDEFMRLKYPEKHEELSKEIVEKMSSVVSYYDYCEKRAAENGEDVGAFLDRLVRKGKKEILSHYDTSVLDDLGMTVDELLDVQAAKRKRKKESGVGPQKRTLWALDTALRAFLTSESRGHSYAEAVNFAFEEIALEHDEEPGERQVSRWLNELQKWGVTSIPPPRK